MTGDIAGRQAFDADDDFTRFADIDAWIFDLDDTLYTIDSEMAEVFDSRMRGFIMREVGLDEDDARGLQKELFDRHGATARGLMIEHGVTPDDFLEYVHDVDHTTIEPNPALSEAIAALPGRRFVLTNSPRSHAERVLEQIGATRHFEEIFDFVRSGREAKPHPAVYSRIVEMTGVQPKRTAIFEDMARNLREPQKLGMTTVLVVPPRSRELFRGDWDLEAGVRPEVDFITEELSGFLTAVIAATAGSV